MVESPPADAGDAGSCPCPGRSHMPQSGWAREPWPLGLRIRSLCSATGEATTVRGPRTAKKKPCNPCTWVRREPIHSSPATHTHTCTHTPLCGIVKQWSVLVVVIPTWTTEECTRLISKINRINEKVLQNVHLCFPVSF